jgi:hypothetical protein
MTESKFNELKNDITLAPPRSPRERIPRMVHSVGTVALSRGKLRADH